MPAPGTVSTANDLDLDLDLEAEHDLEQHILALLDARAPTATICPSEVARALAPEEEEWRSLMEPVRLAARRLVAKGLVEVTQRGSTVDPATAKGPIRIRKLR